MQRLRLGCSYIGFQEPMPRIAAAKFHFLSRYWHEQIWKSWRHIDSEPLLQIQNAVQFAFLGRRRIKWQKSRFPKLNGDVRLMYLIRRKADCTEWKNGVFWYCPGPTLNTSKFGHEVNRITVTLFVPIVTTTAENNHTNYAIAGEQTFPTQIGNNYTVIYTYNSLSNQPKMCISCTFR